jgi:hypothetical protein
MADEDDLVSVGNNSRLQSLQNDSLSDKDFPGFTEVRKCPNSELEHGDLRGESACLATGKATA